MAAGEGALQDISHRCRGSKPSPLNALSCESFFKCTSKWLEDGFSHFFSVLCENFHCVTQQKSLLKKWHCRGQLKNE